MFKINQKMRIQNIIYLLIHQSMKIKKEFLIFTVILLLFTINLSAQPLGVSTVNFRLSGLQPGDKSVVSFGSDSYLDTKTISTNGDYVFDNIPAGKYFIKVEAAGYNLPNAQTVTVKEDGSIDPIVGIQLAITKMSENPNEWTHSWSEDVSNSGYTTTAYVNNPPVIEFLGVHIVPSDVPFTGELLNNYNIILSDEEEAWTQEYAYRLVETLKTIPYLSNVQGELPSKFILTADHLYEDITVENVGGGKIIRISKDCFYYANPFLVNLDGVRGRFFSKRLHHALVDFATDFGNNLERVNRILSERFGCTTNVPDYSALTAGITNEDAGRFQAFNSDELVSIINMFEELPDGFHKTPHLNYLIRRLNGTKHPIYPESAAVAWCVDNGYIEFMETAFSGDANGFDTQRLILHEKTHFLWAFTFPEEIKNDWITLGGWYKDPNAAEGWSTTKDTEFVTAYAHGKNPDEDMAESVAYYLKNPEMLQSRSMPKYEFIRDRIMHGVRYISKIPDYLTFEVLNLDPDYDYPGKIKRLDVKVEGAPDEDKTVTVEIELNHIDGFNDGAIGGGVRLTSPLFIDVDGEKRSQFVDIGFGQVDGNPWILRGQATVPKYSKSGYWTAGDIIVSDIQNNQRFEGRNDAVWNMYVNNPLEDLEAPKYEKGSLNYQVVDTIVEEHNAQILRVTYHVSDNIGVAGTFVRLVRESGDHSYGDSYGTYDSATQTATVDFLISEFFSSDNYYVTWLAAIDSAYNWKNVAFSSSPLDEPIQKIRIETANPDTIAPEVDLNRITVYAEPTHPEAPDGETLVTINFYARDDKSGLGWGVRYSLKDPQGIEHGEWFYHRNWYTVYFDGDPTVWEKYTISCILPQGSPPGIWGLSMLTVQDKAWNSRTYNFVETLIFEPDNSTTDYVLFADIENNNTVNLGIESETDDFSGFTYRIINEDTGEEISGEVNNKQPQQTSGLRSNSSINSQQIAVDISNLSAGKLIIIVQIKNDAGEIVGVRSGTVIKSAPTYSVSVGSFTNQLTVYPTPAKSEIFIKTDLQIKKVEICDISGRTVATLRAASLQNGVQKISVSALQQGIYMVRIYTDNGLVIRKVIKE